VERYAAGADVSDESSMERDGQIRTIEASRRSGTGFPSGSGQKRRILRAAGASFAPASTAYRSAHGRLGSVEPLKRRRRPGLETPPPARNAEGPTAHQPAGRVSARTLGRARDRRPRPKMRLVERDVSGGRRQRRKQIGRGEAAAEQPDPAAAAAAAAAAAT